MNISFKIINNKMITSFIHNKELKFRQYNFYKSVTLNRTRYITNPIDEILISQREIEFFTNEHICFIEKYPTIYQCSTIGNSTPCSTISPVIILELTPTALLQIL